MPALCPPPDPADELLPAACFPRLYAGAGAAMAQKRHQGGALPAHYPRRAAVPPAVRGKVAVCLELYNSDDTVDEYWGWEYDDTGHIQKYLHYNKDKQLVGYVEFEYDAQGNMVREVGYDSTGKVMNEHQY